MTPNYTSLSRALGSAAPPYATAWRSRDDWADWCKSIGPNHVAWSTLLDVRTGETVGRWERPKKGEKAP